MFGHQTMLLSFLYFLIYKKLLCGYPRAIRKLKKNLSFNLAILQVTIKRMMDTIFQSSFFTGEYQGDDRYYLSIYVAILQVTINRMIDTIFQSSYFTGDYRADNRYYLSNLDILQVTIKLTIDTTSQCGKLQLLCIYFEFWVKLVHS